MEPNLISRWEEIFKQPPYLALQCRDQLTVLGEDSQVEVVVVVSDGDLPGRVDTNSNRIVGDACKYCNCLMKLLCSSGKLNINHKPYRCFAYQTGFYFIFDNLTIPGYFTHKI